MSKGVENIGKRDVAWSYAATIFTIGAGVILLPFILHRMSAETVGVWNIFQTITLLVAILDFGFRPSFARSISYIFSGVKSLHAEGVERVNGTGMDYSLLKGTLTAMRRFYRWMALAVFLFLSTAGTAYFGYILTKYTGDRTDAMIAWVILITINCYNLYTLYYDALLTGKGLIRRYQQISILGQSVYMLLAIGLIYAGMGLSAIVTAQLASIVIRRYLSYKTFFTKELKDILQVTDEQDPKMILKAIYPNAIKVGLTQVGGFAVNKSAVLLSSAFLSLEQVACYGITVQVMDILARCATVPYQSFVPKLAQCRAEQDWEGLRRYYIINEIGLLVVYCIGGAAWLLAGDWALSLIHSQTTFVPCTMLIVMLVISFLEHNHSTSAGFIMADNKIPFFIPSLVSGAATIILLYIFLGPLDLGIWGAILAPGIAQLAYQNWKWPSVIIKELFFDHGKLRIENLKLL